MPLFTYSAEFQHEAAKELTQLRESNLAPNVVTLVEDYGTTRDAIRECSK